MQLHICFLKGVMKKMKWMKFRIKTITDAEDIIISTLYDIGLEGAQIEDKIPLTALEKAQIEAFYAMKNGK